MNDEAKQITEWISNDPLRWELLGHVRDLALPDCWVAAGFIRNAVWDILHDRAPRLTGDVDVIWFDLHETSEARDRALEAELRSKAPDIDWSVKNQARMHIGNGDPPYTCSEDAMRNWPETATAIGVRRTEDDYCELLAPFGLRDLLALELRPAGVFATRKRAVFEERLRQKYWLDQFPRLVLVG